MKIENRLQIVVYIGIAICGICIGWLLREITLFLIIQDLLKSSHGLISNVQININETKLVEQINQTIIPQLISQ